MQKATPGFLPWRLPWLLTETLRKSLGEAKAWTYGCGIQAHSVPVQNE